MDSFIERAFRVWAEERQERCYEKELKSFVNPHSSSDRDLWSAWFGRTAGRVTDNANIPDYGIDMHGNFILQAERGPTWSLNKTVYNNYCLALNPPLCIMISKDMIAYGLQSSWINNMVHITIKSFKKHNSWSWNISTCYPSDNANVLVDRVLNDRGGFETHKITIYRAYGCVMAHTDSLTDLSVDGLSAAAERIKAATINQCESLKKMLFEKITANVVAKEILMEEARR